MINYGIRTAMQFQHIGKTQLISISNGNDHNKQIITQW